MIKKVVNCARCGGTHEKILFLKFNRPPAIPITGREPFLSAWYWSTCPTSNEPILLVSLDLSEFPDNEENDE
jgi:hypothetical protein